MRCLWLVWVALRATLAPLAQARPAPSPRALLETTALLEGPASKSFPRTFLQVSADTVDQAAPEKAHEVATVATLEQKIAGLEADKKGLMIAVRRLLKANQTESQQKMLSVLRAAKLDAQASAKKLTETESADKAQLAKLQKLQQGTEEKLVQELSKLHSLQHQESGEEAALAALRKKDEDTNSKVLELEKEVAALKERGAKLEEEKRGLEATVQKLWQVNASSGAKTMLKMLGAEDERLKVVDLTRQSEEKQFAQEKSELSQKLSEAERKHEADVKALAELRGENLKLRFSLKGKASLEVKAKAVEGLQESKKQLEAMLSKEKEKNAKELQAAQENERTLRAQLEKDEAEKRVLQTANAKLASESEQRKAEADKLKAAKDADENIFAQALTDLQQKVNKSEALLRQKDVEIKEAADRGMKFYVKKWEEAKKSLQDQVALKEKEKHSLEENLTALAIAEKKRGTDMAKLIEDGSKMRDLLKKGKLKLTYALDKENSEMLRADKLEAENKALVVALQKEKALEPKLTTIDQQDRALKASNLELQAAEKAARAQLDKMRETSDKVKANAQEVRKKLDFAVDQENTQMIAVKILQSENRKLKETVQNQTNLQAVVNREEAYLKDKDTMIKNLETKNVNAAANFTVVLGQIANLKRVNGLLQDQYTAERSKRRSVEDQFSTESLAVKVLQGQNQKLNQKLQQVADEEADMAQVVKASEAKATASEIFEAQGDQMRKDLAAARHSEDKLRHKNDELQETIVAMAAKVREAEVEQKLQVEEKIMAKDASRIAQKDAGRPSNLEKASSELDNLVAQLRKNNDHMNTAEADDA